MLRIRDKGGRAPCVQTKQRQLFDERFLATLFRAIGA
ncbi:hypothetical protein BPC006_I0089 [Burkholderia pseudomallei BPC006]|nr:hypothetical protein BPC006_I0089 [Burkholderia pseudomallei BPC006]